MFFNFGDRRRLGRRLWDPMSDGMSDLKIG